MPVRAGHRSHDQKSDLAPVDQEQRDWDLVETYECGLQIFAGMIRHPCPSDPKFPSLDDYVLICERTSDQSSREWQC
jgi:hypothetical protein